MPQPYGYFTENSEEPFRLTKVTTGACGIDEEGRLGIMFRVLVLDRFV
jgi:hypothetical protein